MGEKIIVGPIEKGLKTNREPFVIDNDSFPTLINAYQWRGRVKRKRGTSLLGQLRRFVTINPTVSTNLIISQGLEVNSEIIPGSVTIIANGGQIFTEPAIPDGTLIGNMGRTGTINYANGNYFINDFPPITGSFVYAPSLPVMGLEETVLTPTSIPGTLGFDTKYSYAISRNSPFNIWDVSFYKNPPSSGLYVQKGSPASVPTPFHWNGEDYRQFWTVNYEGALWATNGVNVPFNPTKFSMQYAPSATITGVSRTSSTTVDMTISNCPLVVGDFVFLNEWSSATPSNATFLNFLSGFITKTVGNFASLTITITFPGANIPADTYTGGIVQYLTNNSDSTKDCIKWYDGDPTNGLVPPTYVAGNGWVNFMPPLSEFAYSIAGLPQAKYYLVGAKMIYPFKDRLLFIGPVVQTSTPGSAIYLPDTVVYSQNGTPYYTCTFNADPLLSTTSFNPILVPVNQTATASAWWEDQTGFGGFVQAGVSDAITTVSPNEDVLIMGFTQFQSRFVYTGNDVLPFNFFIINSELGTASTFSFVNMDQGVLSRGNRGYVLTSQTNAERFDVEIPDQVFEINLQNNGNERFCAQRDFINEWIYFTYPSNSVAWNYPNQTLLFNYRDNSFAVFYECYTTYGTFRVQSGYTWATLPFTAWTQWTTPWNAGDTTLNQLQVIAGNQQGFVIFRETDSVGEGVSLEIGSISFPTPIVIGISQAVQAVISVIHYFSVGEQVTITGVVGMTQLNGNTYTITAITQNSITINVDSRFFGAYVSGGIITPENVIYSPNHNLNEGDYITISGALGTVGSLVNGKIFSVAPNVNVNSFALNPSLTSTGTYLGLGKITRLYFPQIQTKQFPVSWGMGRKTRLGPQQYMFSTTSGGQITLQIYLSQDEANAYNLNNNSCPYSQILYTCPESTNLGLTPLNTNLQMLVSPGNTAGSPASSGSAQIWHRVNTSLIGDTVQIGFILSDDQMRDPTFTNQYSEIELHSFILDVSPSMNLA